MQRSPVNVLWKLVLILSVRFVTIITATDDIPSMTRIHDHRPRHDALIITFFRPPTFSGPHNVRMANHLRIEGDRVLATL